LRVTLRQRLFVHARPLALRPLPQTHNAPAGAGLADAYACAAVAVTLFLLLSTVVYEQYLLWPLPFLAILVVRGRLGRRPYCSWCSP
jgi:hypothetical protein